MDLCLCHFNMKNYKDFAISLAHRAGAVMKKNFVLGMKKEWKADLSPVTETDRTINQMVIHEARKQYPGYSVLAEEGSDLKTDSEYTWVCDPVDGTIAFSHGLPTSAFMLALVHQGISILGIIYDPWQDRLFYAEKGRGTTMNGAHIKVAPNKDLSRGFVEVEYWPQAPYNLSNFVHELFEKKIEHMCQCAYGLPVALVASGDLRAAVSAGKSPWDGAAAKIIVEEAGGKVTDLFGREQRYDQELRGQLVSNGLVHNELLDILNKTLGS